MKATSIYGFLGGGLGAKKGVYPLDAGTNMSSFFNHSWYGLVTALAASKLGDPTLFPEPSNKTVEQSKVTNQNYFPSENTGVRHFNRLRVRPKRV